MNEHIRIATEVEAALAAGGAVVALESTIITHGMPWPRNVEVAKAVEADVRREGAVPATIAVIDGTIRVGLAEDELEALAQAENVAKLSRADLALAVSNGSAGSTTVAATMICAALAGIRVFATGGIGGVHRGAAETFDVSADLEELARTDVTVVCAGAKAILDVGKTLEVLETKGVPVVGLGTDVVPAFWSRESPHPVPIRHDALQDVANLVRTRRDLKLGGGLLLCVPVPEGSEIRAAEIEAHIDQAIADADSSGVKGKAVTPYLLSRMLELTKGRSLETNVALIRNNALVAARLALLG